MPMFATISDKLRAQPTWQKIDVFVRLRPHCLTEIEQDEEHCLEAMLHWHDPVAKLRTFRCRSHTLVDDNPASG
jgi:hypothetical protein